MSKGKGGIWEKTNKYSHVTHMAHLMLISSYTATVHEGRQKIISRDILPCHGTKRTQE